MAIAPAFLLLFPSPIHHPEAVLQRLRMMLLADVLRFRQVGGSAPQLQPPLVSPG
jgi:hypothetical protein